MASAVLLLGSGCGIHWEEDSLRARCGENQHGRRVVYDLRVLRLLVSVEVGWLLAVDMKRIAEKYFAGTCWRSTFGLCPFPVGYPFVAFCEILPDDAHGENDCDDTINVGSRRR